MRQVINFELLILICWKHSNFSKVEIQCISENIHKHMFQFTSWIKLMPLVQFISTGINVNLNRHAVQYYGHHMISVHIRTRVAAITVGRTRRWLIVPKSSWPRLDSDALSNVYYTFNLMQALWRSSCLISAFASIGDALKLL